MPTPNQIEALYYRLRACGISATWTGNAFQCDCSSWLLPQSLSYDAAMVLADQKEQASFRYPVLPDLQWRIA